MRLEVLLLVFMSKLCFSQSDKAIAITNKIIEIKSINPKESFQADLSFLDTVISDKSIVFLGEAQHGDSKSIEAKSRIIKYLIEKLKFEVVVFEFPFYEMEKANQYLRLRKLDPNYVLLESFRQQGFISKTYKEKLIPILSKNRGRINIGGVEIFSNSWYSSLLNKDLLRYKINKQIVNKYLALNDELSFMVQCALISECLEAEIKFKYEEFYQLSKNIDTELSEIKRLDSQANIEFLKQVISSNIGLAKWIEGEGVRNLHNISNINANSYHSLRDKTMAENLIWLLTKRYPGKKFIVSTSTYHISRDIFEIPVMADYLPDSIVERSYFIPFITYQGKRGYSTDIKKFPISEFKRDSLSIEYLFHSSKLKYGFLDFKSLSNGDIEKLNSLSMYPSNDAVRVASWPSIYDGIFFIDLMEPDLWVRFSIKDDEYFEENLYR